VLCCGVEQAAIRNKAKRPKRIRCMFFILFG
jgi:hypothetical protein